LLCHGDGEKPCQNFRSTQAVTMYDPTLRPTRTLKLITQVVGTNLGAKNQVVEQEEQKEGHWKV